MAQSFREYLDQARSGGQGGSTAGPSGFAPSQAKTFGEYVAAGGSAPALGSLDGGDYREWYTGRNLEGERNGWNTQFMHEAQTRIQQAYERGDVEGYFSRPDAFGVVTWDNAGKDSKGNALRFGSVVENGAVVGNVYEEMDDHVANVMMGEWLIPDGRVKQRMNNAGTPDRVKDAWSREITDLRRKATEQAELAPRAREFESEVEERAEGFTDAETATGVAAATLTGAATWGAAGAAAGAWLGPGALVTGAVGALAGGVISGLGTWMNQDALKYQVARSQEAAEWARRDGADAALNPVLQGIGQNFYSVAMNPLGNMVKGFTDAVTDGVGTGAVQGSFYATTDEGERTTPGAVQALDLVATTGDSLLQFASPFGRAVYTAQMATTISGTAVGMLPGFGQWDDRRLEVDSIWTRRERDPDTGEISYSPDLGSAAAGIGTAGIEIVQLGGVRGLMASANRESARLVQRFDMAGSRTTGRLSGEGAPRLFRAPGWLEGRADRVGLTKPQRDALKAGTADLETRAGFRFVVDKSTGKLIDGQRWTMSLLAPSEALQALSAKAIARRAAATRKGGIRSEDLYQAATDLTIGERKITMMLVNAFGEGQEEAIQGLLEPLSHHGAISPEEVFRGFAGGFAAGLGMAGATALARPHQADQMYALGALAHMKDTGGAELSREQWEAMSHLEQRRLVQSFGKLDRAVMEGAYERIDDRIRRTVNGQVVGAQAFKDERERRETEQVLKTSNRATDAALVIQELDESKYRPDAVVVSHLQLREGMENRMLGTAEQTEILKQDLAQTLEELKTKQGDQSLLDREQDLRAQLTEVEGVSRWLLEMYHAVNQHVDTIDTAIDGQRWGDVEASIKTLNAFIEKAYDGRFSRWNTRKGQVSLSDRDRIQIQKAMSWVPTRYPQDTTGSWSVQVPLVDEYFAKTRTQGAAGISQTQLAAKRGDYDGDKIVTLQQLMLDDGTYFQIRGGINKQGAEVTPAIDTPKDEVDLYTRLGAAFQGSSANQVLASLADSFYQDLYTSLRRRYANTGVLTHEQVSAVMTALKPVMEAGGDVRQALMKEMFDRHGAALNEYALTDSHTDEAAWLAWTVAAHIQTFQKGQAALTPQDGVPSLATVEPMHHSSEQMEVRARRGATKASQLLLMSPASEFFRAYMSLHFSKKNTTEQTFEGYESDRLPFSDMVFLYEQMSADALRTKLEVAQVGNPVLQKVLVMLYQHLEKSDNVIHDMAVLANTAVNQFTYEYDDNGVPVGKETGKQVTLLQQMMYLALQQYKRDNGPVWGKVPAVQMFYNKMFPLTQPPTQKLEGSRGEGNAAKAFVEVFGSVQLYDLLGDAAVTLGSNLTVGQAYRRFKDMHPDLRRQEKASLKTMGDYKGPKDVEQVMTSPYTFSDAKQGRVTAYRSVVDALFSAASSEISMEKDGTVVGRMKSTENKIRAAYEGMITSVRSALEAVGGANWTAQQVANYANANPEFGRKVYQSIPKDLWPVVYRGTNSQGEAQYAEWFFDIFTQPSVKQSEMLFLKMKWIDGWRAKSQALKTDKKSGEQERMAYHSLDSRMHQLMFTLATHASGNPQLLEEFIKELEDAQDLDVFLKWVNTQPGYTGDRAPYLGWVDNPSEFDATKSGSGWSGDKSSTQVIEGFESLTKASDNLLSNIRESAKMKTEKTKYRMAVQRYLDFLDGKIPQTSLGREDKRYFDQFHAAAKLASERRLVYGPWSIIKNVTLAVYGIRGKAHEKGKNPEEMAATEMMAVRDLHFQFAVNFDKYLADLTSYDESDVAGNPGLIMRDGGTMMLKDGTVVEWDTAGVDKNSQDWGKKAARLLLPMLEDEKHEDLFFALMSPQVVELNGMDNAEVQLLFDRSVPAVLNGSVYSELYPKRDERISPEQALKYLAIVESQQSASIDPFAVQHKIFELAIARSSSKSREASWAELERDAVAAAVDVAIWLQGVGQSQPYVDRNGEWHDPAHDAWKLLIKEARRQANAQLIGFDLEEVAPTEDLVRQAREEIAAEYRRRREAATDEAFMAAMAGDTVKEQDTLQWIERLDYDRDRDLARFDNFLYEQDVHIGIRDDWLYHERMPESVKEPLRQKIMDHVQRRGDLLQGAGAAFPYVSDIQQWYSQPEAWRDVNPPSFLTEENRDEIFDLLSRAIISVELRNAFSIGTAGNVPAEYPAEMDEDWQIDQRKYMDYTFGYLADSVSPYATHNILQVVRDMARAAGKTLGVHDTDALYRLGRKTLFKDGSLGPWTETLPGQNIEAYKVMTAGSGQPGLQQSGQLSKDHGGPMHAAARTVNPVDPSRYSSVTLEWADLDWDGQPSTINGVSNPKHGLYHNVPVKHPNMATPVQRPFIQLNNSFAAELTFTYIDPTTGQPAPVIDLMQDKEVARRWAREFNNPQIQSNGLREVHMDRVKRAIVTYMTENKLANQIPTVVVSMRFVHPDTQDTTQKGDRSSHYHSVWHDGTIFDSNGDASFSLLGLGYFGIGGINEKVQQGSIDTRKKGTLGYQDYDHPSQEDVQDYESTAGTDWAGMLLAKTEKHMLSNTLPGGKSIDPSFYKFVYKKIRLQHWLKVQLADGTWTRWTSEQVIEWQLNNPGADIFNHPDFQHAEIWKPSRQVLSEMTGDPGYAGVRGRVFDTNGVETDLTTIGILEGWTPELEEKFPTGPTTAKTLLDTDVSVQPRIPVLSTRLSLNPVRLDGFRRSQERIARATRRVFEHRLSSTVQTAFNPRSQANDALSFSDRALRRMDTHVEMPEGFRWMAMSPAEIADETMNDARAFLAQQQGLTNGMSTAWVYQHLPPTGAFDVGTLTADSLGKLPPMMPNDLVMFDVASFDHLDDATAVKEAMKALDTFVGQYTNVMLVSSRGKHNLIAELSAYLQADQGYVRYADNALILSPEASQGRRFANEEASASELSKIEQITTSRQRLLVLLRGEQITENSLWIPMRKDGTADGWETIHTQFDPLPLDVAARFNVPRTQDQATQVLKMVNDLNSDQDALTDLIRRSTGIDRSKKLGRVAQAEVDLFLDHWKKLVRELPDRVQNSTSLPQANSEFGTGDFIPLIHVDSLGNPAELLLYRHGHKFPDRVESGKDDWEGQLRKTRKSKPNVPVAIYGEIEDKASSHTGTVTAVEANTQFGFRLELELSTSELGQKFVVEFTGMKYLLSPMPNSFRPPQAPVFGETYVHGFGSLQDVLSKQAGRGIVRSFRDAMTVLGWDFSDVVEQFFGDLDKGRTVLKAIEKQPPTLDVKTLWEYQNTATGNLKLLDVLAHVVPAFDLANIDRDWLYDKITEGSFEAEVIRNLILYLMTPRARFEAVLSGTGLNIAPGSPPQALTTLPPEAFTRLFDLARPDGVVKEEMGRRLNERITAGDVIPPTANANKGSREGWFLDVHSWKLIGTTPEGKVVGYLQYGEPHASSDSTTLNEQASARKQKQSATRHSLLGTSTALGVQVQVPAKALEEIERFANQEPLPSYRGDGRLWKMFTHVDPATSSPGTQWQITFPAEYHHLNKALRRFVQYRKPIDMTGEEWADFLDDINKLKGDLLKALGLRPNQGEMIDYWIRQMMYRPAPTADQKDLEDYFWPGHVVDVLQEMLRNAEQGYFPTRGGNGPSQMSEVDLRVLYHENRKNGGAWAPVRIEGDKKTPISPTNYGEWISVSFGQAFNSENVIDPVIALDMDGYMNTYRQVLKERGHMMDVSFDKEIQARLLDPKTNELITVTTSPVEKDRLMELVYLPAENITFSELKRGMDQARDPLLQKNAQGWRLAGAKKVSRWRSKHRVRPYAQVAGRDFLMHGEKVIDENANANALQRIALALRHGMAMLNPGLYLAALPEQGFRATISQMVNILQGDVITSGVGGATARAGQLPGRRRAKQETEAEVAELEAAQGRALTKEERKAIVAPIQRKNLAKYSIAHISVDQVQGLNDLFSQMGRDGTFTNLIIGDMMYQQPGEPAGKIVSAAEKFARVGNLWQDPTWGTTQHALARRYLEAVIRIMGERPVQTGMTLDGLIANLKANSAYVADKHPEIHKLAVNSVVEYRGLKHTIPSLMAKRVYGWAYGHKNPMIRGLGTILKMQLMYTTYNANVLMTMTGTQGAHGALALLTEGRQTPGTLANRVWKKITNQPFTAEDDIRFDMSSTLDGFSVANAFIKGGVTHTGLFLLGMFSANGLGLSGEDDEMRRRRRLAAMQNAPLIADPRRLEADFRNKDALFLDFLPPQLQAFLRVAPADDSQDSRAMVQINWMLKPFLNPIIGMERFFMTGDFNEITSAIGDAVGSFPLFLKRQWDDAVRSSEELVQLAAQQEEIGTPTATKNSLYLLTSAVGVLERQMFENMFINSLYTGMTEYEVNPTLQVLRDSDGDVQRTIEGTPRENDAALTTFVDPETGEVREAYMRRNPLEASLAQYTKNNFTAAAVLSLFTGGQMDLLRTQMAPRIHTIDLPELDSEEAKILVAGALQKLYDDDGVPSRMFTLSEMRKALKADAIAQGDWETYNNLDAVAEAYFSDRSVNPEWEPLSLVDGKGVESLTTPGAIAVYKGLIDGTVTFDSPALRNVAISQETREQIQAEWRDDTIQDGIDMGLTQELAENRMARLWNGDFDNPSIAGIKDILWDTRIPWEASANYKQLNTTYVQGPDGYPWATGFSRGGFPGRGGTASLFLGIKRPTLGLSNAIATDGRMNSVDVVRGINTGLRGLVPMHATELIPTDQEQTQAIIDAIEDIEIPEGNSYVPFDNSGNSGNGRFWRRYPSYRNGYARSGYGSGSSYSPNINWSRQYSLPRGTNVYSDSVRNIFWDDIRIRRATTRRERYQSARGRLNQWQ